MKKLLLAVLLSREPSYRKGLTSSYHWWLQHTFPYRQR
jgi:hypothetical protein